MVFIVLIITMLHANYEPQSMFYLQDFDKTKTPHYNPLFFLGKELFNDTALSSNGRMSCSSCHNNRVRNKAASLYGFYQQSVFFRNGAVKEGEKPLISIFKNLPVHMQASLLPIFVELGHKKTLLLLQTEGLKKVSCYCLQLFMLIFRY